MLDSFRDTLFGVWGSLGGSGRGPESLNPLNPGLKKISFSTENFVKTMLHPFSQTEEKTESMVKLQENRKRYRNTDIYIQTERQTNIVR